MVAVVLEVVAEEVSSNPKTNKSELFKGQWINWSRTQVVEATSKGTWARRLRCWKWASSSTLVRVRWYAKA